MGGQYDRAAADGDLAQQREDLPAHDGVETGGGFVEDDQLGVVHEGLDDAECLAAAGGQFADGPGQVQPQPVGQLLGVLEVAVTDRRAQPQHVAAAEDAHGLQVVDQDTGPGAQLVGVAGGVHPQHLDRAGRRADLVQQDAEHRALAGSVGAEQCEDLAAADIQVQVPHRMGGSIPDRQGSGGDGLCGVALCAHLALLGS